jgi:hypothetical protein
MSRSTIVFSVALGLTASIVAAAPPKVKLKSAATTIGSCPVFPADNVWNTPIDTLPLDPKSDDYVNTLGSTDSLHPDFGAGDYYGGIPFGIPFITVGASQPVVPIFFAYWDESDPGPWPIPNNVPIEGGRFGPGDRHIIVVDTDNCQLYEAWNSHTLGYLLWFAGSGAKWDLNSNALRPDGWTSADAGGFPIFAGLVRYDEVEADELNHAIRFTGQTRNEYIWPARHEASSNDDPNVPPMGQRFRLKANYSTEGFSRHSVTIINALKTYGMILADNGGDWFISGAPDERWNDDVLNELKQIQGTDFEAIDESSLMVDPDSGQAVQPGGRVSSQKVDISPKSRKSKSK